MDTNTTIYIDIQSPIYTQQGHSNSHKHQKRFQIKVHRKSKQVPKTDLKTNHDEGHIQGSIEDMQKARREFSKKALGGTPRSRRFFFVTP